MFKKAAQLPSSLALLSVIVGLLVLFPLFAHAGIGDIIYRWIVIGFFGWIHALTGNLLNYAINVFVIGFGTQFQTAGIGVVVNQSWAVIRDLFNLTFIFGLVYIGFKMILRSDDSNTRRWLISLVLAALLVNFSLFISKFVIDFSNIVAVEVINAGIDTPVNNSFVFTQGTNARGEAIIDVSGSMKNMLKLDSMLNINPAYTKSADPSFSVIFGSMLIFIVASFVYLSAALLLTIRAAVLIVLMIFSPFLFIGMVFPNLQGTASKLWKMLLNRALFAPVYITLLYITLFVAGGFMEQVGGNSNFAAALAVDPDNAASAVSTTGTTFGPFMLIIALLVISLVAAQKMGVEGANTAVRVGNNLRRRGQGVVAGVGLRRVSRGAEFARNSYDRLDRSKTGRGIRTALAVGTLGLASNNNVRSTLNAGTRLSVSGSETLEQRRKRNVETTQARNAQTKIGDNEKGRKDAEREFKKGNIDETQLNEALQKFSGSFRDMSDTERQAQAERMLKLLNDGQTELAETIAVQLKKSDFDAIEKAGKVAQRDIEDMKQARKDALTKVAKSGSTVSSHPAAQSREFQKKQQAAVFSGLSTKDQGDLPVDIYTRPEMTPYFTPSGLEERLRNGGVSSDDFAKIEKNLQAEIEKNPRSVKKWKQWTQRSNFGSQFNLDFENAAESENVSSASSSNSQTTASERTRERLRRQNETPNRPTS